MTPSKAIASPGSTSSLPKWLLELPMETLGELVVPLAMLAIVIALIAPLPCGPWSSPPSPPLCCC